MSRSLVAFVAGASGNLGGAICRELADAGVSLAVHSHTSSARAAALAESLPNRNVAVTGELVSEGRPSEPVKVALEAFGRIDVIVNAAHPRLDTWARVGDTSLADLNTHLSGVTAHASLCRDILPSMRANGFGRIVYVAGALMRRPAPGFGAYGAAKAAAATLTRFIALEEGKNGITANIVAPGRVVDPDSTEDPSTDKRELAAELRGRMALASFPTSIEVARIIRTLIQPAYDVITGQTVWVTGGEPIT